MIIEQEVKQKRWFHVWCCECKDRTMRPRGSKIKEGCGLWSVYASKHNWEDKRLQPKCEFCNRKKNLHPNSCKVYVKETRHDALEMQNILNSLIRGRDQ